MSVSVRRSLVRVFGLVVCAYSLVTGYDQPAGIGSVVPVPQQSVRLQNGSDWSEFNYPRIIVNDKDNGTSTGSQLVKRLIPDLPAFLSRIALGVCQTLYQNVNEVPWFEQLTFELEYREGVAYKAGSSPRITINLSTQYLESQYNSMGDAAITYEIAGVTWHELTHAYQHNPRNCGGYASGTEFFGFIEGTADAVRILAGYHATRQPSQGGSWTSGYTTTGFFIEWVQRSHDPDFLKKLNQSCLTLDPWSYSAACRQIIGRDITELWNEYQAYVPIRAKVPHARFNATTTFVCAGQQVAFVNSSTNTPTAYAWELPGAVPATSTEATPTVVYPDPGTYAVTLTATNESGRSICRQSGYITVLDIEGRTVVLSQPQGAISQAHSSTPQGEGVAMLVDGTVATKYCVLQGQTWILYVLATPLPLAAYTFTSANDVPERDPLSWTLEGSPDGQDWTRIDSRDNELFNSRYQTSLYRIEEPQPWQWYRWSMQAKSGNEFQLAELAMYAIEAATATQHHAASGRFGVPQAHIALRGGQLRVQVNQGRVVACDLYNLRGRCESGLTSQADTRGLLIWRSSAAGRLAQGSYIARITVEQAGVRHHLTVPVSLHP